MGGGGWGGGGVGGGEGKRGGEGGCHAEGREVEVYFIHILIKLGVLFVSNPLPMCCVQ